MITETATTLYQLADSLFLDIKNKRDPFTTTTVVCPNILMQQWLKTYWLKTQSENVLMNVCFKSLNEVIPDLVVQKNYKLIKRNNLRQVIISILVQDDSFIPLSLKDYYKNNPVKLYDFASSLSTLLLDYYHDNFEGAVGFNDSYQESLYKKVVEVCKNHNFGTIEKPEPSSINKNKICLFGFSKLNNVYQRLIDSCSFVDEYKLEVDENANVDYSISFAPSKVREIEYIHSEICKLLIGGASVSDFLVVAPNMGEYVNSIERVFRQNDETYPSIPYVINHREKIDTDVVLALKLLNKIHKNGFYTRLDFYNLVSNPVVQKVRNISNEEIDNWMKSIVKLNVYRDHSYLDDWKYFKKRLLLSKVSSVNFFDNVVSLKDGDYLPFTNIEFDDESINKIIQVINDLECFMKLLADKNSVDESLIINIKNELDKWFSFSDGEIETNQQYKKILQSMKTFSELNSSGAPLDVLFYNLFDDGAINSIQRGNAFSQGVTFIDFDVNSIFSAKYVFFIGASSNNIPTPVIKNEIDFREDVTNNDEWLGFTLLCQNALKKLFVSYVAIDLKNDEEFYLSPLVEELNKKKNKYIDGGFNKIPLDETRPYSELFTRKEFNDKKYFNQLLSDEPTSGKRHERKEEEVEPIFRESLSVSEVSKFLTEPLSYKAGQLFNKVDNLYEDIKMEWEPFVPDALTLSILTNKVIFEMVNGTFNYEEMLKTFNLGNLIPTVNKEYAEHTYESIVEVGQETFEIIKGITDGGKYQIVEPMSIKLVAQNGQEWMLTSSNYMALYIDGDNRTYIELKEAKSANITKFLTIYTMALMDIATLDKEKSYHVYLAKGGEVKKELKPFVDRTQFELDIMPSRARELLNAIHDVINDYSKNPAVPLESAKAKIDSYDKLRKALLGDYKAWSYFDHRRLFNSETDLGYNAEKFEKSIFIAELNKQIEMIEYLEPKAEEEEEKTDE